LSVDFTIVSKAVDMAVTLGTSRRIITDSSPNNCSLSNKACSKSPAM